MDYTQKHIKKMTINLPNGLIWHTIVRPSISYGDEKWELYLDTSLQILGNYKTKHIVFLIL